MIHHLKNIYLSKNGSILDENLNLLEDPSEIYVKYEKYYNTFNIEKLKKWAVDKINDGKITKLEDETYIYAYPYWDIYVYGHIWDSLRQLEEIRKNNISGTLLIGLVTDHINDFYHHLEIFGYSTYYSCNCQDHIYFIKNLIVPTDGVFMSKLNDKQCVTLKNRYFYENKKLNISKINNKEDNFKLYLSRNIVGNRIVINDDEVSDFLINKDYIRLDGKESLEDHLYYFSNAVKIIGYHGSIFKNCIFCCKNPKIYEFCSKKRINDAFKDVILKSGNSNYEQILIDSDDNYNVKIDLNMLKNII